MRKIKFLGAVTVLFCALCSLPFAQTNSNNMNTAPNTSNTLNNPLAPNSATRSDADITTEANTQLAADKTLSGYRIDVITTNGVVALRGNVDTDTQASRAIEVVSSIAGVRDTDTSGLSVKTSNQPFTDTAITAKIKGAYIREKLFGTNDVAVIGIKVETVNGVVFLTGTADTQQQANNAVRIARSVAGVKSVNSKIVVSPTTR